MQPSEPPHTSLDVTEQLSAATLLAHCVLGQKGSGCGVGSELDVHGAPRDSRSLPPPTCVFPARSGASQNKQGEINTCSGQLSAG